MKQSRWMSLIESLTNVAIGYGVAVSTQIVMLPVFGLHASISDNLLLGGVFTIISIARSYLLRRLFETFRMPSTEAKTPPR